MPEQDEVTGATEVSEEVTASAEEPGTPGSDSQDSATKMHEFEARLKELEEIRAEEVRARQKAEERAAEAERLVQEKDRQYKGLQRETTPKIQELNALKQQLVNQTITASKLDRLEKLVGRLAEQQLSPEEVSELNAKIQQEQERQELEALRKQVQQAQQNRPRPGLQILPAQQKRDLKEAYFREFTDVDPLELTDEEWAAGLYDNAVDWVKAVRPVFEHKALAKARAQAQQAQQTPEALAAKIRKELEEQFKAERAKDAESIEQTKQTIKQLQEELAESKRIAEEASKRSRGMDRSGQSQPESAPRTPKGRQALSEIPESWLYGTPEQRAAYRRAMDDKSLRDRLIEQMGSR